MPLPSLLFATKARALQSGRILAITTNIRLGWKWPAMIPVLAFNTAALVTAVKSFIVQVNGL